MTYSLLIKNGLIIDGTGKKPYLGNIGIDNNIIKAVGDISGSSRNTIDAIGQYVAPGFIDLTNHSDTYGSLFFAPLQESMLLQGYTTILLGNCGESLAPILNDESIENLWSWTESPPYNINWRKVDEYYKALKILSLGVNVATLVGHETLRANTKKPQEMSFLLASAMSEGAWGLSSNFSYLDWNPEVEIETLELLKVVCKFDGLYKIHLKDEGKNFLPAMAVALGLARKSKARTVISHFKAIGRGAWGDFQKAIEMMEIARKEGLDITIDVFPYLRTGSRLIELLPSWAKEGRKAEMLARLTDKSLRPKIIEFLKSETLHDDRILIASAQNDKKIIGKTLKVVSENFGLSSEETILEILNLNELNATFFGKTISSNNLIKAFKFSESMLATDGAGYNLNFKKFEALAHPRSFGSAQRFLSIIAPKAKISLEDAIKKMTSMPAKYLKLKSKGIIAEGLDADLVIFELDKFKSKSTYMNPYVYAEGVNYVVVGGNIAAKGGVASDKGFGVPLIYA